MFSNKTVLLLTFLLLGLKLSAQDMSNRGLMDIKDQSEALRLSWAKAFDEAVQNKNFSALPAIRQANEAYLDKNLVAMHRLIADGDGRALLNAVNNYLQIERQFVKDAMLPAESLTAANQEGIDKINQKINDFGDKEKLFLVDINNALITEGENAGPQPSLQPDPQITGEEDEEPQGSVVEERKVKRKGKLPHEQMEKQKSKRKTKDEEEE